MEHILSALLRFVFYRLPDLETMQDATQPPHMRTR
jgi:hypothetical protein